MNCRAQRFEDAARSLKAHRARAIAAISEEERDIAIADVDRALDSLLRAPSPHPGAFGEKLRLLEEEYGHEWQPRHVRALLADLAVFA
jgi:hypothetical protein